MKKLSLERSILSSIEKHFNTKISNVTELGKGACNTIFLLDGEGKKYCLKIERPDKETDEENDRDFVIQKVQYYAKLFERELM